MDTAKFLTPVLRFLRNQISLFKAGKVGGKYLNRKQVADSRTGKMKWVYKYKPVSQRGAHEVTGKTFEKKDRWFSGRTQKRCRKSPAEWK